METWPLERYSKLNVAVGTVPNPVEWCVCGSGEGKEPQYREARPCEDTARSQPPAIPELRPQRKPPSPHPNLGLQSRNCGEKIPVVEAPSPTLCDGGAKELTYVPIC